MSEKTDLQREILLAWHENPEATNAEIAEACDCSASYVSQVTNRFDDYDAFQAALDRGDRGMASLLGEDAVGDGGQLVSGDDTMAVGATGTTPETESVGLAEAWNELPDNPIGHLLRVAILAITLFVAYQVLTTLVAV